MRRVCIRVCSSELRSTMQSRRASVVAAGGTNVAAHCPCTTAGAVRCGDTRCQPRTRRGQLRIGESLAGCLSHGCTTRRQFTCAGSHTGVRAFCSHDCVSNSNGDPRGFECIENAKGSKKRGRLVLASVKPALLVVAPLGEAGCGANRCNIETKNQLESAVSASKLL